MLKYSSIFLEVGVRISFDMDISLHTSLLFCCSPVLYPYVHITASRHSICLHPFLIEVLILLSSDRSDSFQLLQYLLALLVRCVSMCKYSGKVYSHTHQMLYSLINLISI